VVYLLGSIMCLPVLTDGLETMSKQELYAHLRMTGLQNDLMCTVLIYIHCSTSKGIQRFYF